MTTLILPTSQLRRRSGPGDSLLIHITVRIADLLSRCQRRTRRQRSSHGRDRDAKPGSCPGRQEANPGSRICRPWRSYVLTAGLDTTTVRELPRHWPAKIGRDTKRNVRNVSHAWPNGYARLSNHYTRISSERDPEMVPPASTLPNNRAVLFTSNVVAHLTITKILTS
jgi:hypothetical protein